MLLLCLLGIVMPQAIYSATSYSVQQRETVSGVIIDANTQETIVGASIMLKGSSQGTVTDIDGKFSLSVSKLPVTLVVSYVGYQKKEVKVSSLDGALTISLTEDTQMMDEVIVTGYGTFKKSAYAGSAANVKADKIADVPSVSFQDMLQGNATGVQFTSASGQPGASSSINIRGMGSINAANTPLYVIDGVPMISGNISSLDSDSGLDIMSTINTNDIQSITVIKDAAAASLYGSRAANGVIIITTKQGQQGKPKVSLQADWGFSDFAMEYRPVMSGQQRRDYIYNGLYAGALRDGDSEEDAKAYADENIDTYAPVPWCGFVDWDDVLFKKGSHQQYEASLSGGTDKFKYYSSLSYLKQEGITQRSGLERLSGRLNVDYKATNKLTLGANILFSSVNQDVYSEGFTYTSPFYSSRSAVTPSDPVYNEDGTWNRALIRIGDRNPALANEYDSQREYVTRTFNTIYGQYEFIKDLKFKTTFSYDYITTKGKDWADPRTSNGDDINGGMSKKFYERRKMMWGNQLTYKQTFANVHHLDELLGYEIDDQYRDYLSGYATNFATPDKNDLLEDGSYNKEITEKASEAKSIMLDKHAEPNITGGLYNSFRYKWFDLSFLFNYQFGGWSYDTWAQKTEHGGYDMEANIPTYYADSWKKPGDVTKYEQFYEKSSRVAMHKITNSRRLHSTDFLRLKTFTLGFTLPKQWLSSVGLSNARIYMSANNLWTWAAWDYYDPESVVNGSATQATPPLKTVTFGLNVNF